jgi:hypothetical protein
MSSAKQPSANPLTLKERIKVPRQPMPEQAAELRVMNFTEVNLGYSTELARQEAVRCLEEGISSAEDIDKGCKLAYNHPMGPFEMMDLIGLDTVKSVFESMQAAYGERCRPSPLIHQLVGAGRLGRKSGSGFYSYPAKGKPA